MNLKNVSIQLISNHLQIQLCHPRVKPRLSTPDEQNKHTRKHAEYECVGGGGDGGAEREMEEKNKRRGAPQQYECLLVESFISFVFISRLLLSSPPPPSLPVISAAGTELCIGLRGAD